MTRTISPRRVASAVTPAGGVLFENRTAAGALLGERLASYKGTGCLVLGIPRGGVPVAAEVARALDAELDVVVARKLGAPSSPELAIGAVTADGGRYLRDDYMQALGVTSSYIEQETARQIAEAKRRETLFRGERPANRVAGRTVILVDDGLATGATMFAAARAVRAQAPGRLVIAVPIGSREACDGLQAEADEVVCLFIPEQLWVIGLHYQDFSQVEDAEVVRLLQQARTKH